MLDVLQELLVPKLEATKKERTAKKATLTKKNQKEYSAWKKQVVREKAGKMLKDGTYMTSQIQLDNVRHC